MTRFRVSHAAVVVAAAIVVLLENAPQLLLKLQSGALCDCCGCCRCIHFIPRDVRRMLWQHCTIITISVAPLTLRSDGIIIIITVTIISRVVAVAVMVQVTVMLMGRRRRLLLLYHPVLFVIGYGKVAIRDEFGRHRLQSFRFLADPLLLQLQPAQHRDKHNEYDYAQAAAHNEAQPSRQKGVKEVVRARDQMAVVVRHQTAGRRLERGHLLALGGHVVGEQRLQFVGEQVVQVAGRVHILRRRIVARGVHRRRRCGRRREVVAGRGEHLAAVRNDRHGLRRPTADAQHTDLVAGRRRQLE